MQLLQVCWQKLCCSVFYLGLLSRWLDEMTSWGPFQAELCYDPVTPYAYICMCINTYSNGTWLDKREGEILLNTGAGCAVLLDWWHGDVLGFLRYQEGLCCHASAGTITHAGWIEIAMWMCLCLLYLLLLFFFSSVETCLRRRWGGDSLPDLSTCRCYLQRGDDRVHTLSIVLLPSAAQQTWLPIETSIYF